MHTKPREQIQQDLWKMRLENMLDHRHNLYQLAGKIDWKFIDDKLGIFFVEEDGRPSKHTRLISGLLFLKYMYNASDEEAVVRYMENPYWQYFCGNEYFEHRLPCNPSSFSKWRKKFGEQELDALLKTTIETAKGLKLLSAEDLSRVNVDTTVQEKAISFPTDVKLCARAREHLVREARRKGIKLKQTYEKQTKRLLQKHNGYMHAKQTRRADRVLKTLRTIVGRLIREITQKDPNPDKVMQEVITKSLRIMMQRREDKNKLYSFHASEAECISKGKSHKRYEFGCKSAVVTTSDKNFILASIAVHGNPYDGKTLKESLRKAELISEQKPESAYVDRGYKGKENHPEDIEINISTYKKVTDEVTKKYLKRRNAIEPVIGHLKHGHRLNRNYLKGVHGDKINAVLSACGWNLKQILRSLSGDFFVLIRKCVFFTKPQLQTSLVFS